MNKILISWFSNYFKWTLVKADIKFKVKNVPKSTYAIEDATTKFGGFVTYTNLQSTISEKNETKVSQDSTLETTKYIVENNITIRVPNTRLDTVIKTIGYGLIKRRIDNFYAI